MLKGGEANMFNKPGSEVVIAFFFETEISFN